MSYSSHPILLSYKKGYNTALQSKALHPIPSTKGEKKNLIEKDSYYVKLSKSKCEYKLSLKHSLQLHQSLRMCCYITQFYLEVYHHNQNSATKDYFPFSLRAQPLGCKKLRRSCLLYVDVLNIFAIF